jgi:surface polysaccharide O-acyltransferase-like enzyme
MSSSTDPTAASEQQAETTQAMPKFWVPYADWLRSIALFLVIWVHMASPYLYGATLTPEFASYWWSANWGMALARPGVPLFIMLSGVLMLAPHKVNEPIPQFLRKRLGRLVLPFIFWSIAYLRRRTWSRHETFTVLQA